jgi:hypothetical protein
MTSVGELSTADYIAWARARALAYVDRGETVQALSSLISDLGGRADTAEMAAVASLFGAALAATGHLDTAEQMREWIDSFPPREGG